MILHHVQLGDQPPAAVRGMPQSPFARDSGERWELPSAASQPVTHPAAAAASFAAMSAAPTAVHSLDSGMAARSRAQPADDGTR